MTTRFKGLTVAFEDDIRDDDAEAIISAIRQIRGVAGVVPVEASSDDWMARMRVKEEIRKEVLALLDKLYKQG